ncbi:MAG: SMC family ATPase [Candidatus Micrarchaeia archaeon]|jgi:exonuclease SbcC
MITGMALENWKSHASSAFRFGRGTNVLLGRMGAGKSSVLDALCFALYGTFPKMSRRDQSTEAVVNIASGSETASVGLSFTKGGKKYEIARKIGKKVSEAEIRCDGKLAQKGAKPVTDYVTDALGVDYELFTRAIYSEQNRMDHLLSLTPRARKQEIDWLLGLGDFDAAREAAQAVAGKLSEQAAVFRSEADPKKAEEAARKASEQRAEEKKLSESCAALGRRKAELAGKCRDAGTALLALEKARSEWRMKKTECDLLSGSVQGLVRETEGKKRLSAQEISGLEAGRKALEESLAGAKSSAKKLQAELSGAKSEVAVLQSSIKLAGERERKKAELGKKAAQLSGGKSVRQLEAELSGAKEGAEKLSEERQKLVAEAEGLEKAVHALHGAGAKCPVCDSALEHGRSEGLAREKGELADGKRKAAQERAKAIAGKRAEEAGLERALAELKLCLSQAERLEAEGAGDDGAQGKLASAQEKAQTREAGLKKSEEGVTGLEAQLEEARKRHDEAVRTEKLFSELEAAKAKQAGAQAALAALLFDEEKYESARRLSEGLSVELARSESDFSGEGKRLALVGQLCAVLEAELDAMKEKALLSQKYASAASEMAIYKNSLSSAQSELRNALVEEVNEALAEIWPAIYPYADYGGVKLEADEKDYRLLMHKEGWREVDSVASGGERACLCLALRISFATVLTPDIGWLILDEPTHNLDAEAVSLLSEAINSKIPSIVEQTFVITHDPSLGESAQGAVFRLERDKSKGENTRVEKI